MKVAVLIKQTPDTAELPKVVADDVRAGKVKATMVINPWDEYAAEEAIQLGDRFDAESVAISMGSPDAVEALKHALAMGVNAAALVDSTGFSGVISSRRRPRWPARSRPRAASNWCSRASRASMTTAARSLPA